MSKKKEVDKDRLVKNEINRLTKLFKDVDRNKRLTAIRRVYMLKMTNNLQIRSKLTMKMFIINVIINLTTKKGNPRLAAGDAEL